MPSPSIEKLKERVLKEFDDFYFEDGKYKYRQRGVAEYKRFISTSLDEAYKAGLDMKLKNASCKKCGKREDVPLWYANCCNEYLLKGECIFVSRTIK